MSERLPFNPGLNRVVLADLPGLPAGAAGSRVNQWLCSWAVAQRMAGVPELLAAALDVAGGADTLAPLPIVEVQPTATTELIVDGALWPAALSPLVAQGHSSALDLADDLGRVLGGLVATLVLGPPDARAGRPEWPESRWDSWAQVRRVAVGGGIVSADLGERMVDAARDLLASLSVAVEVQRAREPSLLVLRGAAAGDMTDGSAVGLVLDCGGTTVKRAVAVDGRIVRRPSTPAPRLGLTAYEVVAQLAGAAAEVAPLGDGPVGVAMALATHVDPAGQPYAGQLGPYAPLASVDLVDELTRALSQHLGLPVAVRVRHDGASALLGARLDDPTIDAVVVLGTAVGNAVDPVSRLGR